MKKRIAFITLVNVQLQLADMSLNRDFIFYYRLQDELPGRIEVIPFLTIGPSPASL